jgi:ribosomal protein S18 acetylase RimI-like enzyme
MQEIQIRPARASDVPNIQNIARLAWADVYREIIPSEIQEKLLASWYAAGALEQAIKSEEAVFLLAERGGEAVGFVQFFRRSPEVVELARIYVLPEEQRLGVGSELLTAGLHRVSRWGVITVAVGVEAANQRGRRFYRKAGFVESGKETVDLLGHPVTIVRCQRSI